jgi:hypothetical protein
LTRRVSVKAIADQCSVNAGTILEKDATTIKMGDPQSRIKFSAKDTNRVLSLMSLSVWQT